MEKPPKRTVSGRDIRVRVEKVSKLWSSVLQNTIGILRAVGLQRIRFMNLVCREVAKLYGHRFRVQRKRGLPPRLMGHWFGPGTWEVTGCCVSGAVGAR